MTRTMRRRGGFTLIELLIVVVIIAILAAVALVNFREAKERATKAANRGNLKTIAAALQLYLSDYGKLPPADREAGPFESHTAGFTGVGNGPAAGGSWDGIPWLLHTRGYISDPKVLFNPRYRTLYNGGETIRGGWPRYHNFRYAYNASGLASGGLTGGVANPMSGTTWIVRDLFVPPAMGWYAAQSPSYPGDYEFPWEDEKGRRLVEHVMYADLAVVARRGGTNEPVPGGFD